MFSSPPSGRRGSLTVWSSPELPSLDDVAPKPAKKPSLRSGSRAAPIPFDAVANFTPASRIWQPLNVDKDNNAFPNIQDLVEDLPQSRTNKRRRTTAKVKPSPDAAIPYEQSIDSQIDPIKETKRPVKRARELPEKTVSLDTSSVSPPDVKPWKKFKPSPEVAEVQTTIPKGKITKPGSARPSPAKSSKNASDGCPLGIEVIDVADVNRIDNEPALKRRMDWTPVKNTDRLQLETAINEDIVLPSTQSNRGKTPPVASFKKLLDSYGCTQDHTTTLLSGGAANKPEALVKRKLVGLVTLNDSKTPETSPAKSKAPKKKPRTITEMAVAPYRSLESQDEVANPDSLNTNTILNYLAASVETPGPSDASPDVAAAKGSKTRAKRRATKKKTEPRKPILLSPASALKQVSGQDFVFGTSSQLASEQDAELLRDLHRAMRASNHAVDAQLGASLRIEMSDRQANQRLWVAGARDIDGDVQSLEVIDLVDSIDIPKDLTNPAVINSLIVTQSPQITAAGRQQAKPATSRTEVLSLVSSSPVAPNAPTSHYFVVPETAESSTNIVASSTVHESTCDSRTVPVVPRADLDDDLQTSHQDLPLPRSSNNTARDEQPQSPRPKYELFTDAQLSKQVTKYGFKAIKKRSAMIALLDQCWASKNLRAVGSHVSAAEYSTSPTKIGSIESTQSKKQRPGRPRKEASAAVGAVTASALTNSPTVKRPRGRPKKTPDVTVNSATISESSNTQPRTAPNLPTSTQPCAALTPQRRTPAAQLPIEIADSDSEESLASPEPENVLNSSPAGADLSVSEDTELSLTLSPTDQQSSLFDYITEAVTMAPRSKDPTNPSWHEKMLMYDPIVLEDLTSWLNAGQLDKVGYDSEVAPKDVKKWCESKSICCLWRVSLRGLERKRF